MRLYSLAGALLLVVGLACGRGDRLQDPPSFAVRPVEYGFVTRALGPSLPVAVVDLSVRNNSTSEALYVSRGQFTALTEDGSLLISGTGLGVSICYDPDYAEPRLTAINVPPLGEARGRLVFLLAEPAVLQELIWSESDTLQLSIELPEETVRCSP